MRTDRPRTPSMTPRLRNCYGAGSLFCLNHEKLTVLAFLNRWSGRPPALAAIMMLLACSSTGGEPDPFDNPSNEAAGGYDEPATLPDGSSGASEEDRGSPAPAEGNDEEEGGWGTAGAEGGGPSDASPDSEAPPSERGEADGCPANLPRSWLFCEDFEEVVELRDVFFEYQDGDGSFVLDDQESASGLRSMRATYAEGVEGAGWLSVSVGENPSTRDLRPEYRETEQFDDLHFRFRVRMEPGWPDVGPGHLSRVLSVANDSYGQAVVATLASDDDDTTLLGEGISCVGAGSWCSGLGDDGARTVGLLQGTTPLFSADLAGRWHCIEGHVRLNSPGESDGMFEYALDGQAERSQSNMDWRGDWQEYGLNLVIIENFWVGGAPRSLSRWIDDFVIATEPIGCESLGVAG